MLLNLLFWIVLVAAAVLFGWLARRAWRARNAALKWGGIFAGGLLALLLSALGAVTLMGLTKAYMPRTAPVPDLKVEGTAEQLARGKHLANVFCVGCHSPAGELPLTGGFDLADDIPIPLGSFVASNLTPAGPLKDWTDGEIYRAIRNGIDAEGRWLFAMATAQGRNLSDEDIVALIAYIRSQPAVEHDTPSPPDTLSPLGVVMLGVGMLPEGAPPIAGVITAPPKGPTVEYGAYIFSYQDCTLCHGEDLRGGVEGQLPPIGPSLYVAKGWTEAEFIRTLRTGVDPSGHQLNTSMPWQAIGRMDDDELLAMYRYLQNLPESEAR